MRRSRYVRPALTLLLLTACGGGGNSNNSLSEAGGELYTPGGVVAGLVGSGLVMNVSGKEVPISGNGPFAPANYAQFWDTPFTITVSQQPSNPAQTCTVINGSGTGPDNAPPIVFCAPPSGETFLYVATAGSIATAGNDTSVPGSLSAYAIDASTGALAPVAGSTVSTGPAIGQLLFVPNSNLPNSTWLWALSIGNDQATDQNKLSSLYVYSINPQTGVPAASSANPSFVLDGTSSTPNGGCGGVSGQGSTAGISFAPYGFFGYAFNLNNTAGGNLGTWWFGLSLGQPSALAAIGGASCFSTPTVDPGGGYVYYVSATSAGSHVMYTASINGVTGVLDVTGSSPAGGATGPVAVWPFGGFEYVLDGSSIYYQCCSGTPFTFAGSAIQMLFAPNGQTAYVVSTDGIYVFAIDQLYGTLTQVQSLLGLQVSYANQRTGVTSQAQIDPSGQYFYVSAAVGSGQQGIYGFAVDPTNGELTTMVPGSPFAVTSQQTPLQLAIPCYWLSPTNCH